MSLVFVRMFLLFVSNWEYELVNTTDPVSLVHGREILHFFDVSVHRTHKQSFINLSVIILNAHIMSEALHIIFLPSRGYSMFG